MLNTPAARFRSRTKFRVKTFGTFQVRKIHRLLPSHRSLRSRHKVSIVFFKICLRFKGEEELSILKTLNFIFVDVTIKQYKIQFILQFLGKGVFKCLSLMLRKGRSGTEKSICFFNLDYFFTRDINAKETNLTFFY